MTVDSDSVTDDEFAAPGQGLRREPGRVDGPADGLRQLPGPRAALPRRAGRAGRADAAGRRRLRPVLVHDPDDAARAARRSRPCRSPRARTSSRTTPSGPSVTYDALQDRLEAQRRKPTRLRIPALGRGRAQPAPGPVQEAERHRLVSDRLRLRPRAGRPVRDTSCGPPAAEAGRRSATGSSARASSGSRPGPSKCPYCMGHCEMNWEVAGLTKDEIAERSRLLAGDDWSSFPAGRAARLRLRPEARPRRPGRSPARTSRRPQEATSAPTAPLIVAAERQPLPLHDADLQRLPAQAGARERLLRLLQHQAPGPRPARSTRALRRGLPAN